MAPPTREPESSMPLPVQLLVSDATNDSVIELILHHYFSLLRARGFNIQEPQYNITSWRNGERVEVTCICRFSCVFIPSLPWLILPKVLTKKTTCTSTSQVEAVKGAARKMIHD